MVPMNDLIRIFFDQINQSITENDELHFRNCWNENNFSRRISGSEGLSGMNLFSELRDNHLHLNPEFDSIDLNEEASHVLIGAFTMSENNSEVDYFYFLLSITGEHFSIVACSRSRPEIESILDNKMKLIPIKPLFESETTDVKVLTEEELFEQYFNRLNDALNGLDETHFAEFWEAKAYYHNLSGEGGLSGKELYTQATNGKWQLNPIFDLTTFFENPDAILIHLSIWLKTLEMEKPGEEGLLLLIKNNGVVKMFGYGTDLSAMRHLYLKFREGTVL
jgi:hypothetical protein